MRSMKWPSAKHLCALRFLCSLSAVPKPAESGSIPDEEPKIDTRRPRATLHHPMPRLPAAAALVLLAGTAPLAALPNAFFGPVAQADSPLNGEDLTERLLAAAVWADGAPLPGDWREEGRIATATLSHLLARPRLFGRDVLLLRALHRDGRLESLDATFADAGSFFGYFNEPLPEGLSRRQKRAEVARRVAQRQAEFADLYADTLGALQQALAASAQPPRPATASVGRTRHLRFDAADFQHRNLTLRLLAADQRLIRVQLFPAGQSPNTWLDPTLAGLTPRQRLDRLAAAVDRRPDGTVELASLRPIPQGFQPYCGLNTLAMVARHLGLHIDEDLLAAAAGFANTGTADGSNLPRVYQAVASEAGLGLDRASRFNHAAARRALAAGLPVVVWRRFSQQRDQLHTRFARQLTRNPQATLPDPADPAERASWPGPDAPLHASVLTGFHDARREFLFLESWSDRAAPRRIHADELAATAYLTFAFQP